MRIKYFLERACPRCIKIFYSRSKKKAEDGKARSRDFPRCHQGVAEVAPGKSRERVCRKRRGITLVRYRFLTYGPRMRRGGGCVLSCYLLIVKYFIFVVMTALLYHRRLVCSGCRGCIWEIPGVVGFVLFF